MHAAGISILGIEGPFDMPVLAVLQKDFLPGQWLGIGVISKSIPFAEVVSFARVRNSWFNGWGIHFYPGGTLYNASGLGLPPVNPHENRPD